MAADSRIRVIILAGGRDFGRDLLAADMPTALWPVLGKPALQRVLDSLADQGISDVVVCSNGESSSLAESVRTDDRMKVEFLEEALPVGTAGAVRDAARTAGKDALFIVLPASMVSAPNVKMILDAHSSGQCELTVMLNPEIAGTNKVREASGIYVFGANVLKHIAGRGYCDIKEGLIPEMVRAGRQVHAAVLPNHAGNFRDRREYLCAVGDYLEYVRKPPLDSIICEQKDSQGVWISSRARVHSAARVCGPAVIMDGVDVSDGAVILGPTVLGTDVQVGADAVVIGSVVWDGATLGPSCTVQRSLIGCGAVVRPGSAVLERSVPSGGDGVLKRSIKKKSNVVREKMGTVQRRANKKSPNWLRFEGGRPAIFLGAAFTLIAFLWCYWPELTDLWGLWQRNDEYSCGILVPFLALYVLWTRRDRISRRLAKPSVVWGLLAFAGAQAFRFYGLFYNYRTAERLSVVLTVASLVLLFFGWQVVRRVFTVLIFLFLMLPWPTQLQSYIAQPLQRWATTSAVFCLELFGYGVVQHGNVIDIEGTVVEVAWACNGLRMVTAFFVITGLVVLLVRREWWEKLIILASSLPIALLCNTIRLAITAIAFTVLKGKYWEEIFHDFGGYAMMPLALGAVVAELWLLKKLTTAPVQQRAIVITRHDV
ncbi:MAG: exosortase [Sedimentisphaerales bacterium]|nr:exosortase [Sedimentisphaerales bacterium]